MGAKGLLLSCLLLSPCTALAANDDVLMQAVSFAVTGSDANKVVVVDRAQCIFRVKDDTYYFNNIYTDRVAIQYWTNKLFQWATVDIHGKKKVVDHFSPPPKGQTTSSSDETIYVNTRESDRLKKAWEYIYANGCKGMTSPF